MTTHPVVRTTLAAALLIVPVVTEIVVPASFDGAPGLLVFAASQLIGWALIWSVVRAEPPGHRRGARFGRRAVLTGIACELAFATVYGLTAFDGEPFEWSFVLFSFGFLAMAVGAMSWGSALLRLEDRRAAGGGFVAAGVLGLLAIAVGGDPWHDIFLLSSYATWPVIGLGLQTATQRAATPTERVPSADTLGR
jgi:hypothetical protein